MKRRDFLKLSGVTLAATALPSVASLAAERSPADGRILALAPLHQHPHTAAPILDQLLPDAVYALDDYQNGWVALAGGFVREQFIQPMLAPDALSAGRLVANLAWVSAAYTPIRAYCSADAPLLHRLGHGAIVKTRRSLTDAFGHPWQQIALGGGKHGWAQAAHLSPVHLAASTPQKTRHAHLKHHKLHIYEDDHLLATFTATQPTRSAKSGRIRHKLPSMANAPQPDAIGAPWHLSTNNGLKCYGVYWHNNFQRHTPHLELSIVSAKTLWELLPRGSRITIS